jgi:hypothetical protein
MVGALAGGLENAIAAIDVPMNGNLLNVSWAVQYLVDTTGDQLVIQLSFGTSHTGVNDSRQVISNYFSGKQAILTAVGAALGGGDFWDGLPDIPVSMGERLYIHSNSAAGTVGVVYALLSFDFDLDKVAVRRR